MHPTFKPLALSVGGLVAASCSLPAFSQETAPAQTLDAVTVTGSHIRGAEISGVGPVTVIDSDDIARSGAISVETLLQRLPASAGFAGNQTNAYWVGNGYGTTQVNLRGIGANRTLVLLNGRRVVAGGTGANSSVDLNMIPLGVIDRVEVLKDGASAIYGADAVAGVVNIITRTDLRGLEAGLRYGETTKGDGDDTSVDLGWGAGDARSSVMMALNYSESGSVNMASRQPCPLGEVDGALECFGNAATLGGRARLPDGSMINFNQEPGGDGDAYEPYQPLRHNYNSFPALNAVNPIKRLSLSAFGRTEIHDGLSAFGELMYTNRRSDQIASPGSLGNYRQILIDADHPTNPTGQDLVLLSRRLGEGGVREFYQETDTYRVVAGLEGRIGQGWNWNAAVNYGRNTGNDGSTNVANLDRVDQTLDRSVCSTAPGAAIPCGDYLGAGDLSQEVLDYIMYTTRDSGGNEQRSVTAGINGELFELPAGPAGFAAGIEYRDERGWRDPDPLTVLGIANANAQDRIDGEYEAREAFAELALPLLADHALAEDLRLNAALRYSDYDLFGDDTNYKLGLDWQIVPALKLRANYSTAFRIPNIPELFGGISEGNLTTTDPCGGWSALPADSVVYRNCQASGVPAGYTQLGNSVLTTGGGNPELQPEQARTFTAGLVWSPQAIAGLTTTLDYYRIRIEDAIQRIPGSTKLAACYTTPDLAHPFCGSDTFTRDPVGGEIDFLSSQPVNAADEEVSGVDLGAIYEFSGAGLRGAATLDVSWLRRYDVTPFQGADAIEYAGMLTGGRGGYPEWRALAGLTLAQGPWSGRYTAQYIGRAEDINASTGDLGHRVGSVTYHNAQLRFASQAFWDLSVGVDNLFDKTAPYVQSWTDANTDTMTYDLLGRRWYARIDLRW